METILLLISICLFLVSVVWCVYIFKIRKQIKQSESTCKASMKTCLISVETIEDISHEQEVYFKKLAEKYRLKLYAAINQYTQSRKEKNKKFTYKTKITNNPARSKKRNDKIEIKKS